MKKITLGLTLFTALGLNAQVLHNNGPLVTHPGGGFGGSDACALDTAYHSTYGSRNANVNNTTYRVAEEFVVPSQGWVLDSVIFYQYQTGSTTTSSITTLDFIIWNGTPDASTIVYGDSNLTYIDGNTFSNIYRSRTVDLLNSQRPIMRVSHKFTPALTLTAGTYYIDWRAFGSLSSGPWVPIIESGNVWTGTSLQKVGMTWQTPTDAKSGEGMGFPFILKGTVANGVDDLSGVASVDVYPNPVVDNATIAINFSIQNPNLSEISFVVYDLLGKEVKRINNLSSHKFNVSFSDLSSGMYMYQVVSPKGVLNTGKVTKE